MSEVVPMNVLIKSWKSEKQLNSLHNQGFVLQNSVTFADLSSCSSVRLFSPLSANMKTNKQSLIKLI